MMNWIDVNRIWIIKLNRCVCLDYIENLILEREYNLKEVDEIVLE